MKHIRFPRWLFCLGMLMLAWHLSFPHNLQAQRTKIDSLERSLKKIKQNNATKVHVMVELATMLKFRGPIRAKTIAEDVLSLALYDTFGREVTLLQTPKFF